MAVFLKATYSKKLGLPQYSSHQYTVEVSAELTDVSQLAQASEDLYARLQQAVDLQIIHPGHVPGATPAQSKQSNPVASRTTTPTTPVVPKTPATPASPETDRDTWRCSDKQRDLILKIVAENHLDKPQVDSLARERFGCGVRELNKVQASGLIDEMFVTYGKASNGQGQGNRRGFGRSTFQGRGAQ